MSTGKTWKQLTRVSIPVLSGDKQSYGSWKAAFMACVDKAPATAEYKLLQLKKYLSGEALAAVEIVAAKEVPIWRSVGSS